HALADKSVSGEMQHSVGAMDCESLHQRGAVAQISLDEGRILVNSGALAALQIVERDDLIARAKQRLGRDTANIASGAGHQYLHQPYPYALCVFVEAVITPRQLGIRLSIIPLHETACSAPAHR